jgi:hypothetical protein
LEIDVESEHYRLPVPTTAASPDSSDLPPSTYNLFSEPHKFFAVVAENCKTIKRISISCSDDVGYIGDSNILMLTNCCPIVEEFRFEQLSGLTSQALLYLVDGWKSLRSLELNTESISVNTFSKALALLGSRLRRLSVTHFIDALRNRDTHPTTESDLTFTAFLAALLKLSKLEILAIDLSNSPYRDGLNHADIQKLLESCSKLKGFEYFAALDAYFETNDDTLSVMSPSVPHDFDPDSWEASWKLKRSHHTLGTESILTSRSRRDSVGSLSIMTTSYFGRNRDHHSKDDFDDDEEDVTSLAPGLPSPNIFAQRDKVELYGSWISEDSLTVKQRALKEIESRGMPVDVLSTGACEEYFEILEAIGIECSNRGITTTIAWSI